MPKISSLKNNTDTAEPEVVLNVLVVVPVAIEIVCDCMAIK